MVASLLLAAIAVVSTTTTASADYNGAGFNALQFGGMNEAYTLRWRGPQNATVRSEFDFARARINQITGANLQWGSDTTSSSSAGEIVIGMENHPGCGGDPCTDPHLAGYRVTSADIYINFPNWLYIPRVVALHELAHAVGLTHYESDFESYQQVMYSHSANNASITDYRSGDVNGLHHQAEVGFLQDRPIGNVESISREPGGIRVRGWAIDRNAAAFASINVAAYNNGVGQAWFLASNPRTDVGNAYPFHGNAGFDILLPANIGANHVCIFGINVGAGTVNPELGCLDLTASNEPFGSFDSATGGGGHINVAGWSIDPNNTNTTQVHVYVYTSPGNALQLGVPLVANTTRADVGAAYPAYGSLHGFAATLNVPAGPYTVCAYAIDNADASHNTALGCKPVTA